MLKPTFSPDGCPISTLPEIRAENNSVFVKEGAGKSKSATFNLVTVILTASFCEKQYEIICLACFILDSCTIIWIKAFDF